MAAPRKRLDLEIRHLGPGAELVLSEAGSCVLVLRGSCVVRTPKTSSERVQAGTLLLAEAGTRQAADLRVLQALGLMGSDLGRRWRVEQLARRVGLSRAAFARRFALATGVPPLRYLSELRLARASELLQSSDASLAELADAVGYASEFAFSRAFKRKYGTPPGVFRRINAPSAGPTLRCAA